MQPLLQDLRHTWRLFRKNPAFYGLLVLLLSLGLGAFMAVSVVVRSLLFQPLPYSRPHGLVTISATFPGVAQSKVSLPDFFDWKEKSKSFQHMALIHDWGFALPAASGFGAVMPGALVSGEYFPMLGLQPLLGRWISPDDDRPNAPAVAVIGAGLWRVTFDGDPGVLGKTILLDAKPFKIVGVAPKDFNFYYPGLRTAQVWVALAPFFPGYANLTQERETFECYAMGRLRPDASIAQAQAELTAISKQISLATPHHRVGARLADMQEELTRDIRRPLWMIWLAVGTVLLLLCANATGLLLARNESRRTEFSLKAALGATPSRLASQALTETMVVFLLSGLLGALLMHYLVATVSIIGVMLAGWREVRLDSTALISCFATSAVFGFAFGAMPAYSTSVPDLHLTLRAGSRWASGPYPARLARRALVTVQVALTFALLALGSLAYQAFNRLTHLPLGFDPTNVATMTVHSRDARFDDEALRSLAIANVADKLFSSAGVVSVAANTTLPTTWQNMNQLRVAGRPTSKKDPTSRVSRNAITPGYFETLRIKLLAGRDFNKTDTAKAPQVVILSRLAVDRFFPNEDPLGRLIHLQWDDTDVWRKVVGVVSDVRCNGPMKPAIPESYVPVAQERNVRAMAYVIRSHRAASFAKELPGIVHAVDPKLGVSMPGLFEHRIINSMRNPVLLAYVCTWLAGVALFLTAFGIYGLISPIVSERSRDLATRKALGAPPSSLVFSIVQVGFRPVIPGLVLGWLLAFVFGKRLAEEFPGSSPTDLTSWAILTAVLVGATLLACAVPARFAARVSPLAAMRDG